jgi:hypothetical protein
MLKNLLNQCLFNHLLLRYNPWEYYERLPELNQIVVGIGSNPRWIFLTGRTKHVSRYC